MELFKTLSVFVVLGIAILTATGLLGYFISWVESSEDDWAVSSWIIASMIATVFIFFTII